MKKDDTYKDKGLRVAVQHKNDTAGKMTLSEDFTDRLMQRIEQQDEKPLQHRMKFWPWIAAACVAAFLVVLVAPPREGTNTEPQIAKVAPKTTAVEVKAAETNVLDLSQVTVRRRQTHNTMHKASASKEKQEPLIRQRVEPMSETKALTVVEEGDIVPYEDPMMQFAEQARALRERGNRVIQRVSMNSVPSNNYPLTEL